VLKKNAQVYGFEQEFENSNKLNELFSEKELKESGGRRNRNKLKSDTIKEVDEKTSLDKIIYKDESEIPVNTKFNNLISDVSSITKDISKRGEIWLIKRKTKFRVPESAN
jgi:hypothetical protein